MCPRRTKYYMLLCATHCDFQRQYLSRLAGESKAERSNRVDHNNCFLVVPLFCFILFCFSPIPKRFLQGQVKQVVCPQQKWSLQLKYPHYTDNWGMLW